MLINYLFLSRLTNCLIYNLIFRIVNLELSAKFKHWIIIICSSFFQSYATFMLIRIVKMTFQKEKKEQFLELFVSTSQRIRQFPGCFHLELLQDTLSENIYYTYSYWKNQEALEMYRKSELFKTTWAKTKILFSEKPEAVSLQRVMVVE